MTGTATATSAVEPEIMVEWLSIRNYLDKSTRRPSQRHRTPLSEVGAMLTEHRQLRDKFAGLAFAPVTMVDEPCACGVDSCRGELGHFIGPNVIAFHLIVLDLDKYRDGRQLDQAGAERAMERLRERKLWHAIYSSHSHRYPDHASLRGVLVPSRPILADEWRLFFPAFAEWLDIDFDIGTSKSVGKLWFLPSHPPGAQPIAYTDDGGTVDVDMIMELARERQTREPAKESRVRSSPYSPTGKEFNIRELIATEYPGAKSKPGGGSIAEKIYIGGEQCPWAHEHTSPNLESDTAILIFDSGAFEFRCLHGHCADRDHEDFRRYHQPGWEPFDPTRPKRSDRQPDRDARDRDDNPIDIGEPTGPDVPPPDDRADATESEDNPNGPWRGNDETATRAAFEFVRNYARHPDGPTLRKWHGVYHEFTTARGCYAPRSDDQIVSTVHRKLKLDNAAAARVVRDALIAVDDVLIDDSELGSWIGRAPIQCEPADLCATRNGLIDLRTLTTYPSTPRFFTTSVLGTVYDPRAKHPETWYRFLRQMWPTDNESIALLQEWFGYCLTLDTRFQKMLGVIGPKRSGKGTIARVLTALLGKDSVCGPSLKSLGSNFGLQTMIGKSAAIISDARVGHSADMPAITERLLNLTGEDTIDIDRKYLPHWVGVIMARLALFSNELPAFDETSGALAGRFLLLELTESFYGKEDHDLTDKLVGSRKFPGELPGILLWAIDGWKRLRARGKFVQPSTSAAMVDDIALLASPVKSWMRDRCDTDPGLQYVMDDAYTDYHGWALSKGHKAPLTANKFGRNLRALGVKSGQITAGARRGSKAYNGIGPKPGLGHYPPPGARMSSRDDVPPHDPSEEASQRRWGGSRWTGD